MDARLMLKDPHRVIWPWLKQQIEATGLCTADFAAKIGVGHWRVMIWLEEEPEGIYHYLDRVAAALGVSVATLKREAGRT